MILYRRGSEVEALSYALHQLNKANQNTKIPDISEDVHRSVLANVNQKIQRMVSNNLGNTNCFDLNAFISQADPLV